MDKDKKTKKAKDADEVTTIKIKKSTRDFLKSQAKNMDDTYDDIILRLKGEPSPVRHQGEASGSRPGRSR